MIHIKKCIIFLLCLSLLPLGGCGKGKTYQKEIFAMDTYMTLSAYGKNAESGLSGAAGIINSLDAMLDPENESGEVYALNHAGGEALVMPGQIVDMLNVAEKVSAGTGGALNLGVYPLVKAWGFIDGKYRVPSDDEIKDLVAQNTFKKAEITEFQESGSYLVSIPAGTQLTFGALAKGLASDYAVAKLRSSGVESAIVSLGGNVRTLGTKPDGSKWNIAIQDPNDTYDYVGILSTGETAVVTSGGYQRYFYGDDGKTRYHHILNPLTGRPSDSNLLSVTIVCDSGLMADALSTALFVIGEEEALRYWRENGGFEMILVTDDNRVVTTSGLYDIFRTYSDNYTYEFASATAES